jgi:Cysteine-rich secretory protein family
MLHVCLLLKANHLANRNELYYCPPRIFNFGQNIFCCVEASLVTNISGQEVASYWYSTIKRYDYFKRPQLLHTNVNAGHFTQIVWKNTQFIGVGKAYSKTGKIFVVGEFKV